MWIPKIWKILTGIFSNLEFESVSDFRMSPPVIHDYSLTLIHVIPGLNNIKT